jgi:hypothetical protein
MGIKLGGFVCDGCSCFEQYIGVKSGTDLLDKIAERGLKNINNLEELNINMGFVRLPNWNYYNVIELDEDWIAWKSGKSICLCSTCDRKYKLNEIISKLKKHD